jgi:RNA polymerase sigma-70 factor (ECF subfamily)
MDEEALAEVIGRSQQGDPAALDQLVALYADRVFGFLFRMTGSRPDAEDLMQEVFVRVVGGIGSYEHGGRFEAWLFRIAANLVRDRVRRARRGPSQYTGVGRGSGNDGDEASASLLDEVPGGDEPSDAAAMRREEVDALNSALAKLSEAEREVIMLRHFSQLSFKEIAEATGSPLGTALARAHRGLAHLREIMGEAEGSAGGRKAPVKSVGAGN